MNFRSFVLVIIVLIFGIKGFAQGSGFSYRKSTLVMPAKTATVNPAKLKFDWKPTLLNLEMPSPGGASYHSFLMRQKAKMKTRTVKRQKTGNTVEFGNADNPRVTESFRGNDFDGSVPTDNYLAISNNGKLISVINSNINFYDVTLDSLLSTISLEAFFDTLDLLAGIFDPKVIYDPGEDKFILVALSGNTDSTSHIVLAFSQTNNPLENWNLYKLPGDTLNPGTWSDYPIVALTNDELFITVNALINDTINTSDSWKYLFKESVIWQLSKSNGYNGQLLGGAFYKDITLNGKPIRNICPIQGGSTTYGPNIYLLSNRNFDFENDTFFIMEITGLRNDPQTELTLDVRKANINYGLAPDGQQPFNRLLQTNDSRVLGGYLQDDQIHFVQNSINPDTMRAAVYHGVITNLTSTKNINGEIIGQPDMDFGYPNISYTGRFPTDDQAMITFNYTSADSFPGFAAVFFNAVSGYSDRITLKSGESPVTILLGRYQRWGDYSGSQRKYDEPGKVWVAGFYGETVATNHVNSTWIAKLVSPDSTGFPASAGQISPGISEVSAYPNPASEKVCVTFDLPETEVIDISVFNVQGQLVKAFIRDKAKKGSNRFSFSTAPLSQGTYLLVIRDSKKVLASKKIVKQ